MDNRPAANKSAQKSQWDEALLRLDAIRRVVERHKGRLRYLLGINQNPGCGGDGSIDEQRWKYLHDEMIRMGL